MSQPKQPAPKVSFFSTLKHFRTFLKNPAQYFQSQLDQHDGLVEITMPNRFVLTDRPDVIQHVLQKNHKNYIKTKIVRKDLKELIGNGLLTSNGDYWLQQRRMIQKGFHRKRLQGISHIMVEEINQYMAQVMDVYAENEQEINLVDEMTHLAFNIVSKGLFSQAIDDSTLDLINRAVHESQQFLVNRVRKPFLKPWYFISGANYRNRKLREKTNNLVLDAIDKRKQSNEEHDDLLQMLLESRYEDGEGMTNQQILEEALILLVAGHETSSMSLAWTWFLLATNPEIEDKLHQHVVDVLGDAPPSFEHIKPLNYVLQVIEESMRLYPPAWVVDREPLEDDCINNTVIKKGVDIMALIYSVHRNPKYWENPEKFDPERFSAENKKTHHPYSYLPFGGGPRLCIGNNFALMEMQFILAQFIRRYRFELVPNQEIDTKPLVTLHPRYGIKVKVKKR